MRGERPRRKRQSSVDHGGDLQLVGLRRSIRDQAADGGAQPLAARSTAAELLWQPWPAGVLNRLEVEPGRAHTDCFPLPMAMIRYARGAVYLVRNSYK